MRISAEQFQQMLKSGKISLADVVTTASGVKHARVSIDSLQADANGALDSVTIHVKGRVPSINSCYATVIVPKKGVPKKAAYALSELTTRRTLNTKGKEFKKRVIAAVGGRTIQDATWYRLDLLLQGPLFNKGNGKVKTWDRSNRIKLIEDAMCDALGIDDSQVIVGEERKVDGPWGVTATLSVWQSEETQRREEA